MDDPTTDARMEQLGDAGLHPKPALAGLTPSWCSRGPDVWVHDGWSARWPIRPHVGDAQLRCVFTGHFGTRERATAAVDRYSADRDPSGWTITLEVAP